MANPDFPVTKVSALEPVAGVDAIEIRGAITFANAADRAAFATELAAAGRIVVSVADSAGRLALTTATVRNGDHVREVGRPEIVRLTCVGNTHADGYTAPAVAWVLDWTCTPDTAGDMIGTSFYIWRQSSEEYVVFWFKVGGSGAAPVDDWGPEGEGVHYREIDIAENATAIAVATAFKAALDAEMAVEMTTARTGEKVRMTWVSPGSYYDIGGNVTTWFEGEAIAEGADEYEVADYDSLEGKTLTLQAATIAVASTSTPAIAFTKTVGFSVAGNVGDIPVTILAADMSADAIAALVQAAVDAHARFIATVDGNQVTVTNAEAGRVNTLATAGSTGFTVTVLQSGITGALTYCLVDEAQIGSAAGWRELPEMVGFSATGKPYDHYVASITARRLLTSAQIQLGGKVVVDSPYTAYLVVNESLLSPDGITPGSDAAFGPNLLAQFAGETRMPYDYAEFDTHRQFDPMTNTFTCKVPGKYQLAVQVDMGQANSGARRHIVQVKKNGAVIKRLVDVTNSGGFQAGADLNLNCSPVAVDLAAGDTMVVCGYVVGDYAIGWWDSDKRAFFQAIRLGP